MSPWLRLAEAGTGTWTPGNTLALAAIVATVAVAVGAQWVQWRTGKDHRREERQRVAVFALGEADGLLIDLHPNRLRDNVGLSRERLDAEQTRWHSTVRPGLSAIALGYPTPHERDLASRLEGVLGEMVNLHRWYVIGRDQDVDEDKLREVRARAEDRYYAAVDLLHDLAAAIRGEAT